MRDKENIFLTKNRANPSETLKEKNATKIFTSIYFYIVIAQMISPCTCLALDITFLYMLP